ncbi:hypothetical protein PoB_000306500 [Plakobranchus ocellatus]|uniref:Uncharacterized protein n=1 Tax=Plakobranchus ocellatus TaxID=259542 RepID=A0AAV3Y0X5_9GAST|nr:hypothetical protein PoB_000306500 [Plakobranchus ocellatus]
MIPVVSAVLVLGLVASSRSTPCTDICLGTCEGSEGIVNLLFPEIIGQLGPTVTRCKAACTTECKCKDACRNRCDPVYNTCKATAKTKFYPFGKYACEFQHQTCIAPCFTQCTLNIAGVLIQNVEQFLNILARDILGVVSQITLTATGTLQCLSRPITKYHKAIRVIFGDPKEIRKSRDPNLIYKELLTIRNRLILGREIVQQANLLEVQGRELFEGKTARLAQRE